MCRKRNFFTVLLRLNRTSRKAYTPLMERFTQETKAAAPCRTVIRWISVPPNGFFRSKKSNSPRSPILPQTVQKITVLLCPAERSSMRRARHPISTAAGSISLFMTAMPLHIPHRNTVKSSRMYLPTQKKHDMTGCSTTTSESAPGSGCKIDWKGKRS